MDNKKNIGNVSIWKSKSTNTLLIEALKKELECKFTSQDYIPGIQTYL